MRGVRRQLADWEEIFTTHLSKTGLISALRENFKWIEKRRQPNRKWHIGSQKRTSKRPLQLWWVLTVCAPEWGKVRAVGRTWGDTVSYLLLWRCAPQLLWETTWKYLLKPQLRTLCGGAISFPGMDPVDTRMCVHQEPHSGMFRAASGVPLQLVATCFLINRIGADVVYPMMDPLQH